MSVRYVGRPINCANCLKEPSCTTPCPGYADDIKWLRQRKDVVRLHMSREGILSRVNLFPQGTTLVNYATFMAMWGEKHRERDYVTFAKKADADTTHFLYNIKNYKETV